MDSGHVFGGTSAQVTNERGGSSGTVNENNGVFGRTFLQDISRDRRRALTASDRLFFHNARLTPSHQRFQTRLHHVSPAAALSQSFGVH